MVFLRALVVVCRRIPEGFRHVAVEAMTVVLLKVNNFRVIGTQIFIEKIR